MKKKKAVLGIIVIGIIFLSIIGVSAGWLSKLFGGGGNEKEGELAESATAYANVTSPLNKPIILYVSKPYSPLTGNLVDLNPYPNSTNVSFYFVATEDTGAEGFDGDCNSENLPTTNLMNYIKGNFSAPEGEQTRQIVSCVYVGKVSGFGCTSGQANNYSCNVTAKWYDRGKGRNNDFYWNISVQIKQPNINMWSDPNSTQQFQYINIRQISIDPNYVNWTQNSLVIGGSNIPADNDITIINRGNVQLELPDIVVNATRLRRSGGADLIGASNFSAAESSPCTANSFQEGKYVAVTITVPKTTDGTSGNVKNLSFCAKNVPSYLTAGLYTSEKDWEININSSL